MFVHTSPTPGQLGGREKTLLFSIEIMASCHTEVSRDVRQKEYFDVRTSSDVSGAWQTAPQHERYVV